MRAKPTLEDVARLAGVSTATVSRALNTPQKLSQETRDNVGKAVEKLGYTPNFGGRVLAMNRTQSIGAVIPTLANSIFAEALQKFEEELGKNGYTLLVASSGYDPEREYQQILTLLRQGVEAVFLIGADRPEMTKSLLQTRRIPHVLGWTDKPGTGANAVGFDNFAAAQTIADHVLAAGHRNIAILSGINDGNDRASERARGFAAAITATKDAQLTHQVESPYGLDAGAATLSEIMQKAPETTAILCGNDVLAAGAILGAQERGVSVPDQLSITGFDDISLSRATRPAITTMRTPQAEIGTAAAHVLLSWITGTEPQENRIFSPKLILRGSVSRIEK